MNGCHSAVDNISSIVSALPCVSAASAFCCIICTLGTAPSTSLAIDGHCEVANGRCCCMDFSVSSSNNSKSAYVSFIRYYSHTSVNGWNLCQLTGQSRCPGFNGRSTVRRRVVRETLSKEYDAMDANGKKDDGASRRHAHAAGAGLWLAAAYRWRSARRHCRRSSSEQCVRRRAQRRRRLQNDLSLQQSSTSSSPSESRRRSVFYSTARAFQRRPTVVEESCWPGVNGQRSRLKSEPETRPVRFESADVGTIRAGDDFIASAPARRLLECCAAYRHKRSVERKTWRRRRRIQSAWTGPRLNWTAMKRRQNGRIMIHVAAWIRRRRTCRSE